MFLRSSVLRGQGQAYSGPRRCDLYIGPIRQPRERIEIGDCLQCMCALCRVNEGAVGVSSLSGISERAPSRRGLQSGSARTGTYSVPALTGTFSEPGHWPGHLATPVCFGPHVCAADTLRLLIKESATSVYKGHRRTLLPFRD